MRTILSILFWVAAFAWMAILSMVTSVILPVVPYKKSHSYIAAPGFALIIRAITLGRFKIIYDPKFDPKRKSVFCMNHTSVLDAFAASAAIPHTFCGVMNAWHAHIPCYGWLMVLSKGIFVRKKDRGRILEVITMEARDRLRQGFSVLAFPEAHRTRDGKIRPFKKGVFLMARDAGAPIVPMAVRGMYDLNKRGSYLFYPCPVALYVGAQVETVGATDQELWKISDEVRKTLVRFVEQTEEVRWKPAVSA